MPRIVRSTIVDAPVDVVWRALRDFNGHAAWHPLVEASVIEEGRRADAVGAVRRFRLRTGAVLREQLLTLDDRERSLAYCILEAPLPLLGYVAQLRLRPVSDGDRTFCHWSGAFDCPPDRAAELVRLVAEDVYEAGLRGLRAHLANAAPAGSAPAVRSMRDAGGAVTDAVVVRAHGGPEVMAWTRVPLPPPGPGAVTLRHTAVGVNFIDVYGRTGYFRMLEPPAVPGMEAAGVVEAVGPGVAGLAPGDRVAYACAPPGAYAARRTMAADLLVPLPDDVADVTAAAVLLKGMTAEFLLHRVHAVKAGDTLVVHAAAGGVGVLLCQWATALGATVIGVVGSAEKARVARAHGAAHVVLADDDVPARVLALTGGRGADVVYDAVGRDSLARDLAMLAVCGHIVSYGQAAGHLEPLDAAALAGRSASLSRPNYGHYLGTPAQVRLSSARLFDALRRGLVRPLVGARLPLRDAAEAHRRLEARATVGATVLTPD